MYFHLTSRYSFLLHYFFAFFFSFIPFVCKCPADTIETPENFEKMCGISSVYLMARLEKLPVSYADLEKELIPKIDKGGISINDIKLFIESKGLCFRAVKLTPFEISRLGISVICMADMQDTFREYPNHFFVARPIKEGFIQILDAPNSPQIFSVKENNRQLFIILLCTRNPVSDRALFLNLKPTWFKILAVSAALGLVSGGVFWVIRRFRMSKSATALLLVILFLTTSCSRSRPPKMEIVGSSKFDGGIVKISDGMNIRHQFRIRNSGGKPLLVFETKSSCGCTTVKVDKEIAPGEEGSIEVLLSMNRFTWGRKSATIVVTTNDVKNPQAIFDITAFAEFGISVNPATVNFGKIPALLESSRKIKIVATRDQLGSNADIQVKALSLGDKNSGMKVTFKRNDEPESAETENSSIFTDAIEMEVKVIPMQSGKNEANIQLQTNLKDYPEIIVPYSWEAYESVRIEPAQVHFGYLAQGSLSERTVKFISDDKKISFKSANVKNGSFKIVRIERQDDGTFDIDLQIQFDSKYQKIEDQLVVTSTDNKTRGVPLVAIRIL